MKYTEQLYIKSSKRIAYENVYKKPKEIYSDSRDYKDVPNSNKKSYSDALNVTGQLELNYDKKIKNSDKAGFWVTWKYKKSISTKIHTYKGKTLKKGANSYDMDVVFASWWNTINGLQNKSEFDKEILELAGLMYHLPNLEIELIAHVKSNSNDTKWTDGQKNMTYEQLATGRANSVKKELLRILESSTWNVKNASKRIKTRKGNINESTKVEIIIYYK